MKFYCSAFFLTIVATHVCLGQAPPGDPVHPSQKMTVLTGGGLQLSRSSLNQSVLVSIETSLGDLWQLGVLGGYNFSKLPYRSYYPYERFLGCFEAGGFAKYFLHGRHSRRKSELYFGPEIRLGSFRSVVQYFGDFFPSNYLVRNSRHTQKFLLRCGAQWKLRRHFICELAIPLGYEYSNSVSKVIENGICTKLQHL